MSQSRPRFSGMDVHKDTMAVASVAQAHGAEGTYWGTIETRQCDIAQRLRTRPAKATQLVFVSAAGPWGSWRYRSLTTTDYACGGGAPSLMPKQAGERVKTDRRDAVPRARLARAAERTPVDVPTGQEAAIRALRRARADALSARKAAQLRRPAC